MTKVEITIGNKGEVNVSVTGERSDEDVIKSLYKFFKEDDDFDYFR